MNRMVLTAVGVDKMLWINLPGQEEKEQGVQFLHVFNPHATSMHKVNT